MPYTPTAWQDSPSTATPVSAANLNKIESGITDAHAALDDLGTAALLDAPASGDAASGQVVTGSDSRLTNARTPLTHTHITSQVTGLDDHLAGHKVYYDVEYDYANNRWPAPPATFPTPPAGHSKFQFWSTEDGAAASPQTQTTPGYDWSGLVSVNGWLWWPAPGTSPL